MAKDMTTGPVSKLEGGTFESSEDIRAADAERLTRSGVINTFGEDLGQKLLDGGYSSLSSLIEVTDDELLAITGIGPAAVAKIREHISLEAPEVDDGLEVETTVSDAVEEADPGEEEAVETDVAADPEEAVEAEGEVTDEVDADEDAGPESVEVTDDDFEWAPPPDAPAIAPVLPAPQTHTGESVRVRRARESAEANEKERLRVAALTPDPIEVGPVTLVGQGLVGVDFVPEPDLEPEPEEVVFPEVDMSKDLASNMGEPEAVVGPVPPAGTPGILVIDDLIEPEVEAVVDEIIAGEVHDLPEGILVEPEETPEEESVDDPPEPEVA